MAEKTLGITVRKRENFSEWYTQVVAKAELADYTAVSGCMVLRPYAYAIWERLQAELDQRFKQAGHQNVSFPLLIPEHLLKKEANHVKGFSPEVAWVTQAGDSKLAERLAIRPTSETIMYDSYSKWIRSWRDLPLLYNQWGSVLRWEFKYPKPFLRTREFLWQEGHTAHATKEEAEEETRRILTIYTEVIEQNLALPLISGRKSEQEKFAGADYTLTLEALMPDGKALQMGTSHHLGQNFSKAFGITYLGKDGKRHSVWQTSWGVSTRLIGALIMVHGDDRGLVLPPRIAPMQAVIVPIYTSDNAHAVMQAARKLEASLQKRLRVHLDDREYRPGWKFNEWELKGVPLRIELGGKDIAGQQAVLVRRDTGEKRAVPLSSAATTAAATLDDMQKRLHTAAAAFLQQSIVRAGSLSALSAAVKNGKLVQCFFCGGAACELRAKETSGATSRCTPFDAAAGSCIFCGKPGLTAFFGKAY